MLYTKGMKKILALFVLSLSGCGGHHYVVTEGPSPAYGPAWSAENVRRYCAVRRDPGCIREKAAQWPVSDNTYRYYYDNVPYGYARRCTQVDRWHANRVITVNECEIIRVIW